MSDLVYSRHSGEQTLAMLEDIADLYDEIHSQMPEEQGGIFSRPSFIARTKSQTRIAGFELVTAMSGDILVGFGFGHPFLPGRWWGDCTPIPRDVLNSSKFAVIELDVRQSYRRQGIAKELLDMLLIDRGEDFATLASTPATVANAMYKRWGWYEVGKFTDSMEALLVPLKKA
jgi:ribosomal protein S18 acetylase RimI-like enzyme